MKKKSIGIFLGHSTSDGGGVFQYTIAMLDALAALDPARYAVRVFTRNKRWRFIARERGVPSAWVPKFGHGEVRKWLGKLPDSSLRATLLHGWNRLDPIQLSIKMYGIEFVLFPDQSAPLSLPVHIKQIACIHDLMHRYESDFPEVGNPDEYAIREQIYTTMVEKCAAIIVDSETGKNHVLESYAAKPSSVFPLPYVIYNGLKKATPLRPSSFLHELENQYLYYPAQFWLHKNHLRLLKAVASLRPELNICCVFSGGTHKNGYAPFLEEVARLGLEKSVYCLGYVTEGEMSWLYQHARCVIMPTFFGPTNIPPLEAMHFGCPVGVSGIYGMPEQLGDAAVYFDPCSVEDMARVICQLWTNEKLREQCIQRGASVAQMHSVESFSGGLENIFQTCSKG